MTLAFTFRVVRYVHDPAVGERLNVGVVLYAPGAGYLGFRFEDLYERLSNAFVDFDGDRYLRSLGRMEAGLRKAAERMQPDLGLFVTPADVEGLLATVWPDGGGCFEAGPVLAGVTDDPEAETEVLFDRMVASQYKRDPKTRRTDEEVWSHYQRSLAPGVRRVLHEKTFQTSEFETTFLHTFKNGLWHVLEPVSMDYSNPTSIQRKAVDWLGNAVALQGHPELGTVYLLLGAPRHDGYRTRYQKAKDLLHKMPVDHQLIEEDEAAQFAGAIADYMRNEGVLHDDG